MILFHSEYLERCGFKQRLNYEHSKSSRPPRHSFGGSNPLFLPKKNSDSNPITLLKLI
ncbi:hypothetical protein HanRHA438_Chr12g0557681 [Helianthus annuus]|uniref:Uncharacterized protein n=1 Tax=Helianthus annuus TaxID=4232 RepID=A0A9K3MWG1_HELAN|nr:hypothetical protein HanXRQr2_Chr12g0546351 [Helianthus annuus]KAJ0863091.1 hypothetical protein HanPSC8_Chr12g0525891 [Helianthus annuus]KAJ0866961.1 hypothetical protein HanRHA438_Chr12g0557681 [Helianthus annuus]